MLKATLGCSLVPHLKKFLKHLTFGDSSLKPNIIFRKSPYKTEDKHLHPLPFVVLYFIPLNPEEHIRWTQMKISIIYSRDISQELFQIWKYLCWCFVSNNEINIHKYFKIHQHLIVHANVNVEIENSKFECDFFLAQNLQGLGLLAKDGKSNKLSRTSKHKWQHAKDQMLLELPSSRMKCWTLLHISY